MSKDLRLNLMNGGFIVAALAIATSVSHLLLPRSYLTPSLYAIPMLFAAHRVAPRTTFWVSVGTILLYLLTIALEEPAPPLSVGTTGVIGLMAIGTLAVWLGRQRVEATERAAAAELAGNQVSMILESITDGFIALDHEQRYTYVNRQAELFLARSRTELLGRTTWEVFPELTDSIYAEKTAETLEKRVPIHFEAPDPTGERWFEIHLFPAGDGLTAYFHDITERRRAEIALRRAEQVQADAARHFSFLANLSRELAATVVDYMGLFQRVAEMSLPDLADCCMVIRVDELNRAQVVGTACIDPADASALECLRSQPPPLDSPLLQQTLFERQTVYLPTPTEVDEAFVWVDETAAQACAMLNPVSLVATPLIARGHVLGVVIFVRQEGSPGYTSGNVMYLEAVSRRCALALDNARLYQQAREAVRVREEFLSVAAHELRTPLTNIKGYIQLLDRRLSQPRPEISTLRATMAKLLPQVSRFEQIVRDLLDISRLDQNNLPLRTEPGDLVTIAHEVFDAIEHSEVHDPQQPMYFRAETPLHGYWDSVRLTQVIANLLSNALKYSQGRGEVVLELWQEGGEAVLAVHDEGVGLTAEEQERVFDPFFRSSAVTGVIPGTGLGLYISKRIVEHHGGTISVESEPGQGSTFTIRLPMQPPQPLPPTTSQPSRSRAPRVD